MDNSINDYVFIEAEAHRYAEEAVKALKKSSQECYSAESGIPNWGARNIQHFSSRRFGSHTNKDTLPVVNQDDEQPSSSSSSSAIVRKSNTRASSASASLLSDIRERKREQTEFVVHTNVEQQENRDEEIPSNDEGLVLIRELKDYLLGGGSIQGKATTSEIIDHFQNRLNGKAGLIPKFKSMLKQIADLQRTPSGMGFWVLKDEFRGT